MCPHPAEIRALTLARNNHASAMAKIGRVGLVRTGEGVLDGGQRGGSALPPVLRRPRECGMCFQNSACMLYHRAAEGGDEETSGLDRGVFEEKVGACACPGGRGRRDRRQEGIGGARQRLVRTSAMVEVVVVTG